MARWWRASQILGKLNAEDAEEFERKRFSPNGDDFAELVRKSRRSGLTADDYLRVLCAGLGF